MSTVSAVSNTVSKLQVSILGGLFHCQCDAKYKSKVSTIFTLPSSSNLFSSFNTIVSEGTSKSIISASFYTDKVEDKVFDCLLTKRIKMRSPEHAGISRYLSTSDHLPG